MYVKGTKKKKKTSLIMYSGEGVASVGDEHASFSDSSIADGDTLDEPCCAHFCTWLPLPSHPS